MAFVRHAGGRHREPVPVHAGGVGRLLAQRPGDSGIRPELVDAVTCLVEAEVAQHAQGPSIEAEVKGEAIIFPLGFSAARIWSYLIMVSSILSRVGPFVRVRARPAQHLQKGSRSMPPPNKAKVTALQRNAASLFKLLGGTADERLRFWEIFKGITTPVEVALIDQQIASLDAQVSQVNAAVKQLQKTVETIQG